MLASKMNFRACEIQDIQQVVEFCSCNGFTPRSVEDWVLSGINAALSFEGSKLVGALPYYSRFIANNRREDAICGYFTSVAIHSDFRGLGVGSQLLQFLHTTCQLDGMFVNSSSDDRSYRWYRNNGYEVLGAISLLGISAASRISNFESLQVEEITEIGVHGDKADQLLTTFRESMDSYNGFQVRNRHFWNERIQRHYYRHYNRYFLATSLNGEDSSYAIFALSRYPDRPTSIDVLELVGISDEWISNLVEALQSIAYKLGAITVRFSCSHESKFQFSLQQRGFLESFSFDILYYPRKRPLSDFVPFSYFHFDYA